MAKNRSAAGITNIIQYDANKNITFVSGSTTLLTISSSRDITTTGKITAQTLVVQTITSSVSQITGSTQWGSIISNTHTFTGSIYISGSNFNIGGNTVTDSNLINVIGNQSSVNVGIVFNNTNATFPKIYGIQNINNSLAFYDYSTNATRMTLTTAGNVGIGTSSPSSALEVVGVGTITSSGSTVLNLKNTAGTGNRSWRFVTNNNTAGDFTIEQSTTDQGSSFATKLNITSGGNVLIGGSSDANFKLDVQGQTNGVSQNVCRIGNVSGINNGLLVTKDTSNNYFFDFGANGYLKSVAVYNNTTGNAANLYMGSTGTFERSTSSIKYKKNVNNYTKGLAEVMQLRAVSYNSINPNEEGKIFAGLIAEEVHDLGLTEFVQYAEDGTPDALSYSHMISLLTKAIQELKAQNDSLQSQINELKAQ